MRSFVPSIVVAFGLSLVVVITPGCRKKTPAIAAEDAAITSLSDGAKRHRPGIDDTASEVFFGHALPAVGLKSTFAMNLAEKMNLSAGNPLGRGAANVLSDKQSLSESEVLAVNDGRVTKYKVHYTSEGSVTTRDGQVVSPPSVVAGHTYVIEAKGSELAVTTEAGADVSLP